MIIFKPIYYLLLCAFYFYANCQDDPVLPTLVLANRRQVFDLEKDQNFEMFIENFSINQFKPKLFIRTEGKVKIQIGINDTSKRVTVDKNMEI